MDEVEDIFRLSQKELQRVYGIGASLAREIAKFNDWREVDRQLEVTERIGASMITPQDTHYPSRLRQIYDPPLLLWVRGDASVLDTPSIAIVGTRKASSYGLQKAEYFTTRLAAEGLTIISGLAYGVDSVAHRTAVQSGGQTVAVLGSGVDNIYPASNRGLAEKIMDGAGAVISEFPPGTNPDAGNFPVRNRIVSGMTLGTLVVESAVEGGSMITARSALDQNREVFVVPHSLDNPSGTGCNMLIKQGMGKLIQYTEDVLDELNWVNEKTEKKAHQTKAHWEAVKLSEEATDICRALEEGPLHIDELSDKLGKASHELLSELLALEMQQCVEQQVGRIFRLK